jgi:hypothetical protein
MDVDVDTAGLPDGGCPEFDACVEEHAAMTAAVTAMPPNRLDQFVRRRAPARRHVGIRPED